ncbi:FixH family protein [Bacillus sp. AK031]
MNSKLLIILTLIAIAVIFAACSNKGNESHSNDEAPEMVEVQINLGSENLQPGREAAIEAVVTQGDEKVEDADEVLFEVWRDGQEVHEEIEGKHEGNGVYAISQTFEKPGTYYVIAHVTARDMHTMPKKEFNVGDTSEEQE